jgi:hypothetical protein
MSEAEAKKSAIDQFVDQNITHDEVFAAAHRAFLFLSACVDGQVPEAKVSDQVMAARAILEYAVRQPDLAGDLLGLAGDADVAMITTALG